MNPLKINRLQNQSELTYLITQMENRQEIAPLNTNESLGAGELYILARKRPLSGKAALSGESLFVYEAGYIGPNGHIALQRYINESSAIKKCKLLANAANAVSKERINLSLVKKISEVMFDLGASQTPVKIDEVKSKLIRNGYYPKAKGPTLNEIKDCLWNSERYFRSDKEGYYSLTDQGAKNGNGTLDKNKVWTGIELIERRDSHEFALFASPIVDAQESSWLPTINCRSRLRIGLMVALEKAKKKDYDDVVELTSSFLRGEQRSISPASLLQICKKLKTFPDDLLLIIEAEPKIKELADELELSERFEKFQHEPSHVISVDTPSGQKETTIKSFENKLQIGAAIDKKFMENDPTPSIFVTPAQTLDEKWMVGLHNDNSHVFLQAETTEMEAIIRASALSKALPYKTHSDSLIKILSKLPNDVIPVKPSQSTKARSNTK